MKQLLEIKRQAEILKKQLDETAVEATEVAGIKIVITGSQQIRSIEIDEHYLRPESRSRLEEDLARAVNEAIKKSQKVAAQRMASVMPDLRG